MSISVCLSVSLSVCPYVCDTFLTMFLSSYHHEIFRSYYQWQKWRPCKRSRSKVKVTEVNTQLSRFRTVTRVWIHIWWRNDAYSLMLLRRGALLFLAATKQLYKWYFPSVCLSVRPSVCPSVTPFLTMFPSSYHHEIFRSYYQWQKWRPCKRSRSEVKGQGHRGHNPTLPFPDCNSSLNSRMMMK